MEFRPSSEVPGLDTLISRHKASNTQREKAQIEEEIWKIFQKRPKGKPYIKRRRYLLFYLGENGSYDHRNTVREGVLEEKRLVFLWDRIDGGLSSINKCREALAKARQRIGKNSSLLYNAVVEELESPVPINRPRTPVTGPRKERKHQTKKDGSSRKALTAAIIESVKKALATDEAIQRLNPTSYRLKVEDTLHGIKAELALLWLRLERLADFSEATNRVVGETRARASFNLLSVRFSREMTALPKLKANFKRLAKQTHPDTHPNDPVKEEQFKMYSQAFETAERWLERCEERGKAEADDPGSIR